MADEIERLSDWYGGSRLEAAGTGGNSTTTRFGVAVADSSDGYVDVVMDDSGNGTPLNMLTTMSVVSGENVIVTAVGGKIKTPIVTSVFEGNSKILRSKVLYKADSVSLSGAQDSIELSEDANNFEHLVIMYMDSSGVQGSVTMDKIGNTGSRTNGFSGARASLSTTSSYQAGAGTVIMARTVTIAADSGGALTKVNTLYSSGNWKGKCEMVASHAPTNTYGNYIWITKVIGYR